jgi:glutamyl/glutaminyl-tRNA synthetase
VGGARTALFNWAFARRHGGKFVLRIEDTDQARSTDASTVGILEDLKWLGIDWDYGPQLTPGVSPKESQKGPAGTYFQSQRLDIYRQYCDQLLASGRAYECFRTRADLDAEKSAAPKGAWKYDRSVSLAVRKEQREAWKKEGRPYVVRFHTSGKDVTIHDQVLGDVVVKADQLEDFVIFKGDGYPTYHFAVVVDDALMGVTHVIRAQEHLINTGKHIPLQEAIGFKSPTYAHLPLIFNPDGTKMSKRDKAKVARAAAKAQGLLSLGPMIDDARLKQFLDKKNDDMDIAIAIATKLGVALPEIDVADFRRSGYEPQVILNYIALLGWNPGENVERFDLPFLIEKFSFDRVGTSNSKFDREKLRAFDGDALRALPPADFEARLRAFGSMYHPRAIGKLGSHFGSFAASYRERSATLNDPYILGAFFFIADDAIVFDAKAVEKVLKKDNGAGLAVLRSIEAVLAKIDPWEPAAIHAAIDKHAADTGQGMGNIAQPLRVAVTGSTVSPAIHDTLAILGKASTLARIARCVAIHSAT